jgi:HD superfamily phosphodiesterase
MFSQRTSTSFFQAAEQERPSVDASVIAETQLLITKHNEDLRKKKMSLLQLKLEIKDTRVNERLGGHTLFTTSAKLDEVINSYRALQDAIENQEREKLLLEISLKKLNNEEPDEALEERASSYSFGMRVNLISIYQQA